LEHESVSVLVINDLKKEYRFGWRGQQIIRAVDGLSLKIEPGEIYGFLGPNGAGKSTTLKTIMGFLTPTSGEIEIFGQDARGWKVREKIGFLPENPFIYPYLTGYQALYIIGKLFSMPGGRIKARIGELAAELGMEKELKIPIRKHSKGMLQRVGLAQALINDPDLILLDEPMSGLDPIGRRMFREVIRRRRESGKTVFFSSHILSDVEMICDRVCILNRGRIVLEQPMAEILNRPDGRRLEDIFMEKTGETK
jgi:ABC-2 type transport system ATP-binding protein